MAPPPDTVAKGTISRRGKCLSSCWPPWERAGILPGRTTPWKFAPEAKASSSSTSNWSPAGNRRQRRVVRRDEPRARRGPLLHPPRHLRRGRAGRDQAGQPSGRRRAGPRPAALRRDRLARHPAEESRRVGAAGRADQRHRPVLRLRLQPGRRSRRPWTITTPSSSIAPASKSTARRCNSSRTRRAASTTSR